MFIARLQGRFESTAGKTRMFSGHDVVDTMTVQATREGNVDMNATNGKCPARSRSDKVHQCHLCSLLLKPARSNKLEHLGGFKLEAFSTNVSNATYN